MSATRTLGFGRAAGDAFCRHSGSKSSATIFLFLLLFLMPPSCKSSSKDFGCIDFTLLHGNKKKNNISLRHTHTHTHPHTHTHRGSKSSTIFLFLLVCMPPSCKSSSKDFGCIDFTLWSGKNYTSLLFSCNKLQATLCILYGSGVKPVWCGCLRPSTVAKPP